MRSSLAIVAHIGSRRDIFVNAFLAGVDAIDVIDVGFDTGVDTTAIPKRVSINLLF